jgi:hypothetical protein
MGTLFERVLSTSEDGNDKLSIHIVQSLMSELGTGRLTAAEAATIMQLTPSQIIDYTRVLTAALSSTNQQAFSSRVFSYLILAENRSRSGVNGGLDAYGVESNFWLMIAQEGAR